MYKMTLADRMALNALQRQDRGLQNTYEERKKQEQQAEKEQQNAIVRVGASVLDVGANVLEGATRSLEGIYDFTIGAVGLVGGIFDADFQDRIEDHVKYDFTSDLFGRDGDEGYFKTDRQWLTDASYLQEDGIVNKVAQGVGGMLPSVVITALTGGAAAGVMAAGKVASSAAFMAGAAGQTFQEALNNGADYNRAFGYGTVSGLIEGATEQIGGVAMGGSTELAESVLGRALISKGKDALVRKGVGKLAYTFVSEGTEEILSDLLDPLNKKVWGIDATDSTDWGEVFRGLPETFVVGGLTGIAMEGLQSGARNLKNSSKGGKTYNHIAEDMQIMEDVTRASEAVKQSATKTQDAVDKMEIYAANRIKQTAESISQNAQKLSEEQRASLFEEAPILKDYLDADGRLQTDFTEQIDAQISSGRASNTSDTIFNVKKEQQTLAQISEKNGVRLELDTDPITETERKSMAKLISGTKALGEKGSAKRVVLVKSTDGNIKGFQNGNTIYITRENLKNGKWSDKLIHETGHMVQGTDQYVDVVATLAEDETALASAIATVADAYADGNREAVTEAWNKAVEKRDTLSEKEREYLSEVMARMVEKSLGSEESVRRIARSDKGTARRILNWLQDTVGTIGSTAEQKRLRKLEKMFEQALYAQPAVDAYHNANKQAYLDLRKEYLSLDEDQRKEWLKEHHMTEEDFAPDKLKPEYEKAEQEKEKFEQSEKKEVPEGQTSRPATAYSIEAQNAVDPNLLDFVESVMSMKSKNLVSKRKFYLGEISPQHAHIIESILCSELSMDMDLTGYKIVIDGNAVQHIDYRHGQNGVADHSMTREDIARIGWAVDNADEGSIARTNDGKFDYSSHSLNADGTPSPKVVLTKNLGKNIMVVIECVPDNSAKTIRIISAYKKSGSKGQVLYMEPNGSPQRTPEAPLDFNATTDSISQTSDLSTPKAEEAYLSTERAKTQAKVTAEYQKEVDTILNGGHSKSRNLIIGYTPAVYRELGMPSLPFVIGAGHVYSAAKTEAEARQEGFYRKGVNYHGLGETTMKDLLQYAEDPVMIISSKDVNPKAVPLRSTHSVVAIVDVGTKGNSLLLPIEITAQRTVNGEIMDVNLISSAYDKNAESLITEAIAQENTGDIGIYYMKKEAAELIRARVQFPTRLQNGASDTIIHRFSEKVNRKISEQTQSLQFKRWFGDWQNDPNSASKVVNADGTPKVMYRAAGEGTGSVYVSDASGAAKGGAFGVYLNIRKPLVIESVSDAAQLMDRIRRMYGEDAADRSDDGIRHALQNDGYDGVIAMQADGGIMAMPFGSSQVKSATDNIGTFDRNNTDPYFSKEVGQDTFDDKGIANYTEEQYNSFGWARVAGAISSAELDDLYAKIQARPTLRTFKRSSRGEAVVEVNGKPHTTLDTDNVFVFVKGTKTDFTISRVVRFDVATETEMDNIRRDLYEGRTCSVSYIGFYQKEGLAREYRAEDYSAFDAYSERRSNRETGRRTDTYYRRSQKYRSGYSLHIGRNGEIVERFGDESRVTKQYALPETDPQRTIERLFRSVSAYSESEIASIEAKTESKVARSGEDVARFVRESISDKVNQSRTLYIGKLSSETSAKIESATGVKTDGSGLALSSYDLRHIFKRHGSENSESLRGQEAITERNFPNVLEAIFTPERVSANTDTSGTVSLVFEKNVDGKTTAVTVVSKKKKTLTLKSAWITKKGQHISPPFDVHAPNQTPNSEWSLDTAPNGSISNEDAVVNSHRTKNADNTIPTDNPDFRFSRDTGRTYSEGEVQKIIANLSREKVYARMDASAITDRLIRENIAEVMADDAMGDEIYTLRGKSRDEVINKLWIGLNRAKPGRRAGMANAIAEYIIDHTMIEESDSIRSAEIERHAMVLETLRPYLRHINLDAIRGEIKTRYDDKARGIFSRWSARSGKTSYTADKIAKDIG